MSWPRPSPHSSAPSHPYNSPRVGTCAKGDEEQEGLKRRAALEEVGRAGVGHPQHRGRDPSYVPSEGNAALLAEALGIPVGSLLAERDRLVEGLRHRPCEAAKEYRGVST